MEYMDKNDLFKLDNFKVVTISPNGFFGSQQFIYELFMSVTSTFFTFSCHFVVKATTG